MKPDEEFIEGVKSELAAIGTSVDSLRWINGLVFFSCRSRMTTSGELHGWIDPKSMTAKQVARDISDEKKYQRHAPKFLRQPDGVALRIGSVTDDGRTVFRIDYENEKWEAR